MKNVLVTGANGFIGRRLCQMLRQQGLQVRTLTRSLNKDDHNDFQIDLAVDEIPSDLFDGIDTIFHLAAKAHALAETQQDQSDYWFINTDATRKLLESAGQVGVLRFIFFSSVKAAGKSSTLLMDETMTESANTLYGQSKYAAEQLVLHGGYVSHPVVIRPCMVYGNSDKGNLPRMIQAIRKGLFPPLPEVNNKRSMVHVDDVVQAALLAAEKPEAAGQVYIVTDGHTYSTREIYDWIRETLGKSPSSISMPLSLLKALAKVGDGIGNLRGRRFLFDSDALEKLIGSAWYSSAKIENELGFKPVHDLRSSLPEIIRHLESNK